MTTATHALIANFVRVESKRITLSVSKNGGRRIYHFFRAAAESGD
jgi:hypothetical protein